VISVLKINQIHQGDSAKLLKQINNNIIDLTVTSPPYDNLRDYKGYSFDFETIAKELYRITKDGGIVVWVVGDQTIDGSETGTSFRQALYFIKCGFKLWDTMIYEKSGVSPTQKRYYPCFEYMFVFSKGKLKTFNPIHDRKNIWRERWGKTRIRRKKNGEMGKEYKSKIAPEFGMRRNIWKYTQGGGYGADDKIAYKHPAIFPEKLAEEHIISWSNKGDLILDPMCGSGTTCKMALLNNRDFIGIEISKEYCEITKKRIKEYSQQRTLLPLDINTKEDGFPPTPKGMGIQPTIL